MNFKLFFDMGWAVIATWLGLGALLVAAPFTILAEAAVIRGFLKVSWWRSARDAILMNVLSGVLGVVALMIIPVPAYLFGQAAFQGEFLGAAYYDHTPAALFAQLLHIMATFCVISIVVEGFILKLLEKNNPWSQIWLIAFISNLVSYLVLFVMLWIGLGYYWW